MQHAPPVNSTMSAAQWGMILFLSLLWGGSFFFNEVAVRELPTLSVVVSRVVLAAVVLHLIMKIMGQKIPRNTQVWRAFFIMGFLNNVVPFSLLVWGQSHIASGLASILNATTPLFTVIVAHAMTTDERMTVPRCLGCIVGLAGVAYMIGGEAMLSLDGDVLAQIACVGAALSYAFAGVFGRRFRQMNITPVATATGQVTASSLMLMPLVLVVDQPWQLAMPSLQVFGALAGVASLSTALAYIIYFRILASAGATNLLLVTFLIPLSAILLGVLFLNEVLLPKHMLGMLMIGAGLVLIDGRLFRVLIASVRGK